MHILDELSGHLEQFGEEREEAEEKQDDAQLVRAAVIFSLIHLALFFIQSFCGICSCS